MKKMRKVLWSGSRAFVNIRLAEMDWLGFTRDQNVFFEAVLNPKKQTILLKLVPGEVG